MTAANISRWKFRLGTTASPPVFNAIEEAFSISGLGQTNQLIDVTNFDSPVGTMEYIAGLADGSEITIECNRIPHESPPTIQQDMIDAVEAKANREFQIAYVGVTPEETFTFTAAPMSWSLTPNTTDKNTISFSIKISGDIVRA